MFVPAHRAQLRAAAAAPPARALRKGEKTFEGKLMAVHLTRDSSWIEIELAGSSAPEVILVNDRRLRGKVASMRSRDDDIWIRAFGKYVGGAKGPQRHVMTDVTTMPRPLER